MKKIIVGKTILLFLNLNDMLSLKRNELKEIKKEYLKKYDNCIIFNYFDLKNNKEIIRDRINKLNFLNQTKINARDCNIVILENKEKNEFLNKYHIQGADKSQIFYGAYRNKELISVMTFDISKGMNGGIEEGDYDLSRFAVKSGYIITGIFSKILKRFINDHKPKKITSFANLNLVNEEKNVYAYNGFKKSKSLPPSYKLYHTEKDSLYHKFTYGTKYFKKNNFSPEEKEEMLDKLKRVWDCGKIKYELFIDENSEIVYGFIYKITNKVNDKIYIGQTTRNITKRIWEYKSAYKFNSFHNQYLNNAFNKYGWDSFEFSIEDTAKNIEELNAKEIEYIKKYNSNNKQFGYNIESGGNNAIPSPETLEKMSKAHSGIKQSEEWIRKRIPQRGNEEAKKHGRPKTEEEKKYLRENSPKYWQGKKRDAETIEKIKRTKKERGISEKQKEASYKPVYIWSISKLEIIDRFDNTRFASEKYNVNQSTISRWCQKNKIDKDIMFTYFNDLNIVGDIVHKHIETVKLIEESKPKKPITPPKLIIKEPKITTPREKPVVKCDNELNILERYESLADAGRENSDGLSYTQISRLVLALSKQHGDYLWYYESDVINRTLPEYKEEVPKKKLEDFTEEDFKRMYEQYKSGVPLRRISDENNITFFTLQKQIKKMDSPEMVVNENMVAVCRKTGVRFKDSLNKSGQLTSHVKELYPDVNLPSKFLRKKVELETGKPWYYDYFEFV